MGVIDEIDEEDVGNTKQSSRIQSQEEQKE
jgi:hypothetical protein